MKKYNCTLTCWDNCVDQQARIKNLTTKSMLKLHSLNSHTATTGNYGDISNICKYEWYEWCFFCDTKNKSPFNKEVIGCVLGPTKGEGNKMAQWILKANVNVLPR